MLPSSSTSTTSSQSQGLHPGKFNSLPVCSHLERVFTYGHTILECSPEVGRNRDAASLCLMALLEDMHNINIDQLDLMSAAPTMPNTRHRTQKRRLVWLPGNLPVAFSISDSASNTFTLLTTGIAANPTDIMIFRVPASGFPPGCGLCVVEPRGCRPERRMDLLQYYAISPAIPGDLRRTPFILTPKADFRPDVRMLTAAAGSLIIIHASTPVAWVGRDVGLLQPPLYFTGVFDAVVDPQLPVALEPAELLAVWERYVNRTAGDDLFTLLLRVILSHLHEHVQKEMARDAEEESLALKLYIILDNVRLDMPIDSMFEQEPEQPPRRKKDESDDEYDDSSDSSEEDEDDDEDDDEDEDEDDGVGTEHRRSKSSSVKALLSKKKKKRSEKAHHFHGHPQRKRRRHGDVDAKRSIGRTRVPSSSPSPGRFMASTPSRPSTPLRPGAPVRTMDSIDSPMPSPRSRPSTPISGVRHM